MPTTDKHHNVNPQLAALEDSLGIPSGSSEVYVNPLDLVRSYEFRKPIGSSEKDYRDRAVDRCVKNKVPFNSECNCIRTLVERMMPTVKCPACKKAMKMGNSGGNFTSTTFQYACDCGCKVGLTLDQNAFAVSFTEPRP